MPILDVEMVVGDAETLPAALAQRLADAAGDVFGIPEGHAWIRLRTLPKSRYAENRRVVSDDVMPVFVSVLKARGGAVELKDEAEKLCAAIARACGRPRENVHILYLPEAAGRMWFGGEFARV